MARRTRAALLLEILDDPALRRPRVSSGSAAPDMQRVLDRLALLEGAVCAGLPEVEKHKFFSNRMDDRADAIWYCGGCPVKRQCLAEGGGRAGIWGGTTPGMRRSFTTRRS